MKNGIAYLIPLKVVRYNSIMDKQTGKPAPGYPRVYDPLAAFGIYAAITEGLLATQGLKYVIERMEAFRKHVQEIENTVDLGELNSYIEHNPEACPIDRFIATEMTVLTDLEGYAVPADLRSWFTIDDLTTEYTGPLTVAIGSKISIVAEDISGGRYVFDGWYDENGIRIYKEKKTNFVISRETTLRALWKRVGEGKTIILFLKKGVHIESVTGGGIYSYGTTVTAKATVSPGASFFGWFKNGFLVSTSIDFTFDIKGYTELEARASLKEDYVFTVDKTQVTVPPQGGKTSPIYITSKKNGEAHKLFDSKYAFPTFVTEIIKSETPDRQKRYAVQFVVKENTGSTFRQANIVFAQSGSRKEITISIQQQLGADDTNYEWKSNDSEVNALLAKLRKDQPKKAYDFRGYVGANFNDVKPDRECTKADYNSGQPYMKKEYTIKIRIGYWTGGLGLPLRFATVDVNYKVNCWFDASIKSL